MKAAQDNRALAKGLNVFKGKITCKPVAEAFGMEYVKLESLLS